MVNEVDLLVCDDCEIILLGEGDIHVCMNCEKPMHYVKFMRQPTPRAADVCPHCHAKNSYTDQKTYPDICGECGEK